MNANIATTMTALSIGKGEIVGLAGLTGAGRTEVAQAIFGVEPAASGTIQVAGKTVRIESPDQAMRLGSCHNLVCLGIENTCHHQHPSRRDQLAQSIRQQADGG